MNVYHNIGMKEFLARTQKKTYINDKPGIVTAIISGIGLIFEPHPENHRVRDTAITKGDAYTLYDTARTERMNFALRFPLLLFNGLFSLFFFWIIKRLTGNAWIALLSFMGITLSPVIIGVSQIINPDTLLWSFSGAAIFSYFALLKTHEKKFILLTSLFMGLSLLSKYTANILFPFFLFVFFCNYVFNYKEIEETEGAKKYFLREIVNFALIAIGATIVFSFFLPAVFVKAKYLYRATIGFPGLKILLLPMAFFFLTIITDAFLLNGKFFSKIGSIAFPFSQKIIRLSSLVFFFTFLIIIFNSLTDQKLIPFDLLRQEAYVNEKLTFGGLLDTDSAPLKITKEMLVQFYPFVFSILPISLFALLFLWAKIVVKGARKYSLYIFTLTTFSLLYFSGSLMSGVLTNIRYSIMLYPLYAFLVAIGISELVSIIPNEKQKRMLAYSIISLVLMISSIAALNSAKPFYFNYTNSLLPKKFTTTDSWGYGAYEAAQYLNNLPNSENLIIWADRNGICQFIKGKCLTQYRIDLTKNVPDYFVISKRGSMRHPFEWKYPELAKKSSREYYSEDLGTNYAWALFIDDRKDNFIKILKSEEK